MIGEGIISNEQTSLRQHASKIFVVRIAPKLCLWRDRTLSGKTYKFSVRYILYKVETTIRPSFLIHSFLYRVAHSIL